MIKSKIISILAVLAVFQSVACSEPLRVDFATYSGSNAAFRSLVLPGWGQWYNSQDAKCYILATLVFAGAGASYYYYDKSNKTYTEYEKTGVKDDPLYTEYETQVGQASNYLYIAAGLWLAGVIDAYFVADNYLKTHKEARNVRDQGIVLVQNMSKTEINYFKRF